MKKTTNYRLEKKSFVNLNNNYLTEIKDVGKNVLENAVNLGNHCK